MSATSENQVGRETPAVPPTAPRLRLSVAGPDGPVQCETAQPVTLIGGRRDCHLPLAHPEVSKVHCAIVNTGRALVACDLSSRSGTFVNEQPVRRASLKPGDTLRIGPVAVQIEFLTAPDAGDGNGDRSSAPLQLKAGGQTFEVRECAAVIGRRNTCDIFLDTPDVSLAHALIFALDGRPALCDLGSRSGSMVNGERVTLAWLDDGDELEIGGEQLAVAWAPPPPPEQPPEAAQTAVAASTSAAPPASLPPELPVGGDLEELERSLAALHTHIAGSRAKLAERAGELDRQSADLQTRTGELDRQRQELAHAQEELAKRTSILQAAEDAARAKLAEALEREKAVRVQRDEIAQLQAHLAQQRTESEALAEGARRQQAELTAQTEQLEQARVAFARQEQEAKAALDSADRQKQELAQREGKLQAAADELARQKEQLAAAQAEVARNTAQCAAATQALEKQRTELAQREAQHAASAQAVQQREAALAGQEDALQKRAEEVEHRYAAIQQREVADKEAARRIGEFRRALHQASQMFTEAVPGGDASAARPAEAAKPSASSPPAPATTAQPAPRSTGRAAQQAADMVRGEELPAPVVNQPIFGSQTTALPSDWPPEMCERFKVLRRMSPKSDAELIAQVLAERESGVTVARAKEKEREKKGGRGWLRGRRGG